MIFGDCDKNFVFINALQYYQYIFYFFYFLGYKPKKKTKKNQKKPKKEILILKKNLFFAPRVLCLFLIQ